MENKKWIGISMTLLVALLGTAGYVIKDDTYFCQERGIVMECIRFSTSGNRCYPSLTTTKGYKDCKNGWQKVEGEIQIEPPPSINNQQDIRFSCSNSGCNPI